MDICPIQKIYRRSLTGKHADQRIRVGQNAFTNADQIRVAFAGNDTIVQVNLDLDTTPEMEIQLTGHMVLTANDFYF